MPTPKKKAESTPVEIIGRPCQLHAHDGTVYAGQVIGVPRRHKGRRGSRAVEFEQAHEVRIHTGRGPVNVWAQLGTADDCDPIEIEEYGEEGVSRTAGWLPRFVLC